MGAPELVAARPATPPVQERCRVLANRVVAPEHNLLTVATREIGRRAQAGQFAQIRVPGGAVFLPRPFSFLAADGDRCMFLSRAIGPGTRALAVLAEGAELELLGPLGHGFDLTVAAAGEVILVGGGVGVPPLVHAAAELAPLTGTALIGAARGEFLLCEQEFAALGWQVQLATDDGSRGHHGFVTELLEQVLARGAGRDAAVPAAATTQPHAEQIQVSGPERQAATMPSSSAQAPWDASVPKGAVPRAATIPHAKHAPVRAVGWDGKRPTVLACGPHAMLHRCADLAAAAGAACQVALEEPMACGFGVCLGCAIRVHAPHSDAPAYALVCRDGPVFPAEKVVW